MKIKPITITVNGRSHRIFETHTDSMQLAKMAGVNDFKSRSHPFPINLFKGLSFAFTIVTKSGVYPIKVECEC